jgi:4-amino-4-deoxy-L-arabinose transferase-like glycosyltransferase
MDRSNPPPRWLAAWIGIALLLRLIWALHLPTGDAYLASLPDQREYLNLGRNLIHGRGLMFYDPRFNQDVFAYRTPGYPIFIALCGGSIRMIRIAHSCLDASTVLAVYLLARRWLSVERSLFAAALVAINPLLVYFTGLVLAETLYTALLAWGMVLILRPRGFGLGVLTLGLSVLVRPSALIMPVFLAAVNPCQNACLNPLKTQAYHWRRAAGAAAVMLALLFPWAWRNHLRLGSWIWTTTNGGITLYDGFNPHADGSSDQSFVEHMPAIQKMGEVQRSDYFAGLARRFAEQHPLRIVKLTFDKFLRTWSPIPLSREYGADWRYVVAGLVYTLPLFLMTAAGIASNRLPMAAKLLLLLPAIYITVVQAASVGSIRYRVPADVPMAVVAAAGWKRGKIDGRSTMSA